MFVLNMSLCILFYRYKSFSWRDVWLSSGFKSGRHVRGQNESNSYNAYRVVLRRKNNSMLTFVQSDFYPNHLEAARAKYEPIIRRFGELLEMAENSAALYNLIMNEPGSRRIQLLRIFKKYVTPDISVEMLNRAGKTSVLIQNFGDRFRSIETVRQRFQSRPRPDEALIAVLREYETRGEKGYRLTSIFFDWFRRTHTDHFILEGPERAGKDIELREVFHDYPKLRPVDFVIRSLQNVPLVIGFARYDSDRGGAQEDDRTGGYGNAVREILEYSKAKGARLKILFLNDGPGLLLGSMWRDYTLLEDMAPGRVMVVTLKMLDERVTQEWIQSEVTVE
jgi:hypothetical protein